MLPCSRRSTRTQFPGENGVKKPLEVLKTAKASNEGRFGFFFDALDGFEVKCCIWLLTVIIIFGQVSTEENSSSLDHLSS